MNPKPYTLLTLQQELGKAVRKSIKMGYADGAGIYARMLARFVMSQDWNERQEDLDWFLQASPTLQRQVQSLVRAMVASGRSATEALAIARQVMM